MSDYKEQVNSLREHADLIETSIELYGPSATRLLVYDLRNAAAAIEDLQAELEKKRMADCWGCKCEKVEPKRGEWIVKGANRIDCSVCGHSICFAFGLSEGSLTGYNYCPNCGAKMNGEQNVE